MSSSLSTKVSRKIGILPGDVGSGPLHYEAVQTSHIAFDQAGLLSGKFAHVSNRIVVVKRFQMIFEGFAADRLALLDY
jgi:hypothetical protein